MQTVRIKAVVENDGELRLSNLPCRKGDEVEAIVFLPDPDRDAERRAARERFLERARASKFRSVGPYPSRDELHERH